VDSTLAHCLVFRVHYRLIDSFQNFLPTLFGYFLVTHSIQSKKQLNIFLLVLTLLSCFLAIEGIIEFHKGISYFGVEPIFQNSRNALGDLTRTVRIIWLGVFSDPNDLAMAFVIPVPILLNSILVKKRIMALIPLALLLLGIFYTNSRGGMLAVCSSVVFYFVLRQKSLKGLIIASLVIAVLVVVGPSRMADLSASGASAHGRVDAWYSGYQMFMQNPIFGVGKGLFTNFNDLTAHNSYVLVLGELGAFGLFFFTGVLVMPFRFCVLYVWGEQRNSMEKKDLYFCASIYSALVGLLTTMFFLSRSYVVLPYMVVGLCMVLSRLYRTGEENDISLDTVPVKNIAIIMLGIIVGIRVLVKVLL